MLKNSEYKFSKSHIIYTHCWGLTARARSQLVDTRTHSVYCMPIVFSK